MEINVRKVKSAVVLDLTGPLLMGEAEKAFLDATRDIIDSGARKVGVNLAGVQYIDSSGVGALVRTFKRLREVDGKIRFFAPSRQVRQILRMVRLDTLLELTEDEDTALKLLLG